MLVDYDFSGKTVEDTIEIIMNLATELGYIDFDSENAILVTTEGKTPEDTVAIEETITQKIEKFVNDRNIKIDVIKARFEATEDIKTLAETLGISVGKVKLITYAMAFDETLTLEAAATMPVRDLNRIIVESRKEVKNFYNEEIRSEYLDLKDNLKITVLLERTELINTALQDAPEDKFTALLSETTTTVAEIKALYQAYYDELLVVEVPTEEEIIADEEANKLIIDKLKAKEKELQTKVKDMTFNLYKLDRKSQAFKTLNGEIKTVITELRDVKKQLNELVCDSIYDYKDNHYDNDDNNKRKGVFGNRFGMNKFGKDKKANYDNRFNPMTPYQEVTNKYAKLFEDKKVSLKRLELLFTTEIKDQLDLLEDNYEIQVEALHDDLKDQAEIIKNQVKEENKVLRDIWKK
jgi:hypothetical protein